MLIIFFPLFHFDHFEMVQYLRKMKRQNAGLDFLPGKKKVIEKENKEEAKL